MKMEPKAKKAAPAPPKAEAKAKALKAKKQCWKASTATNKRVDPDVIHVPAAQNAAAQEATQISSEECPQEKRTWPLSSSISPSPLSQPWRKQKTTPHWCSVWTSRPTSSKLNRPWRGSMTLMRLRSAPSSGLTEGRRRACVQLAPD